MFGDVNSVVSHLVRSQSVLISFENLCVALHTQSRLLCERLFMMPR